jgi:hypothetical protein
MENAQSLVSLNSLMPKKPLSMVYQDSTNQYREEESVQSVSRIQINSPTLSLNSRGVSFTINNADVYNATMLYIELPPIPDDVTLQKGWGIGLLSLCTVYVAGASPFQLTKEALWATLMREAGDDRDKRNQILELAGNSCTKAGDVPRACIYLPLPWSSARFGGPATGSIGLDSALIRQSIRLVFDFNSVQSVVFGVFAGEVPETMSKCYLQLRSDVFRSAKDMAFREEMANNANRLYNYEFYYTQGYESPPLAGSIDPSNPAIVSLSGFRNASLMSITLMLQEQTGDGGNNPLYYQKIGRLRVNYNGTYLFRWDDKDVESCFDMEQSACGESAVTTDVNNPNQVQSPFVLTPAESYWSTVVLGARDEKSFKGVSMSGLNLSNQVITIELNTPNNENSVYKLYAIYSYSASYLMNNSNAEINYS